MKYIVLEFSFMEAPDYTVFLENHYLVSASKLLKDQNYYGTRG